MKQNIAFLKQIFSHSFSFLKEYGRVIVMLFVPIEAVLLLCNLYFNVIAHNNGGGLVFLSTLLVSLCSFVFAVFNTVVIFSSPEAVREIKEKEYTGVLSYYKSVLKKAFSLFVIQGLVGLLSLSFAIISFVVFVVVASLPYLLSVFLVRLGVEWMIDVFLFLGKWYILVPYLSIFFILFIIVNFYFAFFSFFATMAYLFEGRKNLHAITTSFLIVSQNKLKTFLSILVFWITTAIPFLILVGPLYIHMWIADIKSLVLQRALLPEIQPVLPDVPLGQAIMLTVLGSIATLIAVSINSVFRFYLWQEIKKITKAFDETTYTKTQSYLKSLMMTGSILLVLCFFGSLIVISFFGIRTWH